MSAGLAISLHFRASNVAANSTTRLTLMRGGLGAQIPPTYRLYPMVLSAESNAAIQAGSALVIVTSDGTPIGRGPQVTLDAAHQVDSQIVRKSSDSLAATAAFGVSMITTADFAPGTLDFDAILTGVILPGRAANVYPKAAPRLMTAEIGLVDAFTVNLTLDVGVTASSYSAGVSIRVDGNIIPIDSAIRQDDDHHVLTYVLHSAAVANQTVTWEYEPDTGSIVSEVGGVELVDALQAVTNNVAEVPPEFDSAEVGNVDDTTVAVTFDSDVTAANYATGVTIKVNDVSQSIASATRQTNHAVVYYVIPSVISADTVTWDYSATTGLIRAALDGSALATVTAQAVTNNVAPAGDPIGDVLRADAVAYWTMNETSGARNDSVGSNDLDPQNIPASVAGKVLNAARFISVDSQSLTVSPSFDTLATDFTWALWVKLRNKVITQDLVARVNTDSGDDEYVIQYSAESDRILLSTTQVSVKGDNYGSPAVDTWLFVVCSFEEGTPIDTLKISINNGAGNTQATEGNQAAGDSVLSIGAGEGWDWHYSDSDVDEVAFWKRLLTTDELAYLYNSGAGRALFPAP